MGTLTGITKHNAGVPFALAFQDGTEAEFQDSSIYIIFQYMQAFIKLIAKD